MDVRFFDSTSFYIHSYTTEQVVRKQTFQETQGKIPFLKSKERNVNSIMRDIKYALDDLRSRIVKALIIVNRVFNGKMGNLDKMY